MTKFVPQRKNVNQHTLHGTRLLEKSISSDGFIDAQTAAADGEIISGSARLELSAEKFADVEPIVVHSDGSRPVIVVRDDIPNADHPRARRLSVAANQIAKTDFSPDGDLLKEWGDEDKEIRSMFRDDEWKEYTGEEKPTVDAEPQIDRAAELLEKWQVKTGDLWQIGEHRLVCGDCTNAAVVARVMGVEKARMVFTDPPWNVAIGKDSNPRHRQREGLQNDDMSDEDYSSFVASFVASFVDVCSGDVYCKMASEYMDIIGGIFREKKFHWSATIIWVKDIFVLGRSKYHRRYEPVWYGWHDKQKSSFCDARDLDDVWEIKRPRISDEHPTMMPVELPTRGISNSSKAGDIVYEPFSGSGTTLVACQNLSRRGRAIEISPAYCAVTLERMATAFPALEIRKLE